MITCRRLDLPTSRRTEFIDVTSRIQEEVTASGLLTGRVHLQSLHTTFGLAVNENEPLLLMDLEAMLERVAPRDAGYRHDDLSRRSVSDPEEPVNGHAHCRQLLLQPACTVLVEQGRLVLGRWQSVFGVELDGPRRRQLALQLEGDFGQGGPGREAPAAAAGPMPRSSEGPEADADRRLVELELCRQLLIDPEPVRTPMQRLVDAGGKRLRPTLVMMASRLGSERDGLRASALATAVELIHVATLVHDDYVDRASTRRGRATVAFAEGPERAIAVGDYYFAKATRIIAELGNPDVTATIAAAMETICLSQMDDLGLRGLYPGDYAMYLRVVRGKTAALFAAACKAGAQLSRASPRVTDRLERFGDFLGVAFQMVDDLLDYSERSGKPLGQDIRERVVSLPLVYATEDDRVGPRVRELLGGSLSESEIREVQRLVIESGALEKVGAQARGLVAMAMREIEDLDMDGVRPALQDLARSAVDRVS